MLKICNTAWKSYKKRLIRDFMANGRDPIPIYPYIDPDTWKTFKKEIFKGISGLLDFSSFDSFDEINYCNANV